MLAETGILLIAIVPRFDTRARRDRREWRPNLVGDADTAIVTLDAGDREQGADRQPWFLLSDLEVERDWLAPLGPGILGKLGERVGDGIRAGQAAERVRDRPRAGAQSFPWLDEELARGMGASLSEAHAARAAHLTGERARRAVARSLDTLVERAQNPGPRL